MYVCICHALTDDDVRSAEAEGAACNAEVFRHFGVRPQCGRCIPSMRGLLGGCPSTGERCHANDGEPPPRKSCGEER